MNSTGVVVGKTPGMDGWVYRSGRVGRLPSLLGKYRPGTTFPSAVTSRGDIVGVSSGYVVFWPAGQLDRVRPVANGPREITGVSDDGLMVGDDIDNEARLWNRNGTIHPLPPEFLDPRLIAGSWVLGALDVGNGHALTDTGFPYALWNFKNDETIILSVDPTVAINFIPIALSASGAVLVTMSTAHGSSSGQQGSLTAVFRDGRIILLPPPKGSTNDDIQAGAISADGRTIVGTNGTQPLTWHC